MQFVASRERARPIVAVCMGTDYGRGDAADRCGPLAHLPYELEPIDISREADVADDDIDVIRVEKPERFGIGIGADDEHAV
jgi:hypothetical protein